MIIVKVTWPDIHGEITEGKYLSKDISLSEAKRLIEAGASSVLLLGFEWEADLPEFTEDMQIWGFEGSATSDPLDETPATICLPPDHQIKDLPDWQKERLPESLRNLAV
jgi:hypothetical protein